jgi:hypothetical protein
MAILFAHTIAVITIQMVFVKYDWCRLLCRWLYDNGDASPNLRPVGEFPAQPAAEHSGQHQQGQPDEPEKKIVSIFRDDPIEKLEHRVEHCGRIQVHVISSGYALAITGSTVLDISANLVPYGKIIHPSHFTAFILPLF